VFNFIIDTMDCLPWVKYIFHFSPPEVFSASVKTKYYTTTVDFYPVDLDWARASAHPPFCSVIDATKSLLAFPVIWYR